MNIIENVLKIEMVNLIVIYIGMAIIRLICDLITNKINIKKNLAQFLKLEVCNICLIISCVLIDHALLLKSQNFFEMDLAAIVSTLLILDEFMSIISDTNETATSHWLLSVAEQLHELMIGAVKKK
ncbi:hypothetical protein [Furfurilactobacillus entadae]|uniref:hypothetical protein n=1 Tax=Furfurilactobacillus entadae TaxID=2922307 RepID=UPI0035F0F093